jgi:hypothetical protein
MDNQAQDIAPEVLYEWNMFEWCANELQKRPEDYAYRNCLLESFLMHARVLHDFFMFGPKEDAVSAQDFLLCPYLSKERRRLQGMVPHLTYRRLDYKRTGQKPWNVTAIIDDITRAWAFFLASLPPERRHWFS